jgi:hypothetical protein
VIVVVGGSWRLLKRQYDSYQERAVNHLLQSSRRHEAEGRLGQSLVDLDAALDLAAKAGGDVRNRVSQDKKKRPDLARRDAGEILDRLKSLEPASFSLGEWLNLQARAAKDPDLQPLVQRIDDQFQQVLQRQVESDLRIARSAFQALQVVRSLAYCDQVAGLIRHLSVTISPAIKRETEALVIDLISTHGVKVDAPQGRFLFGPSSYASEMSTALGKALESKGYLPYRESSPWNDLWKHALYHARLDVTEVQDGEYLSSQNRLTRIESVLTLTSRGEVVFRTAPTARSQVPLPNLPVYLASRAAASPERSAEFERLLYNSARDQIDEKFRIALENMPPCPAGAPGEKP